LLLLLLLLTHRLHLGLMFGNSARHPRALEFAEVDAAWAVAEGLSGVMSAAAGGRHQRHASHPALDAKIEMHNLLHCK
jgi:hypothetical protein